MSTQADPPEDEAPGASERQRREVGLALGNAVKLGSSLMFTWGIALFVRLYIPRFLGPERFGILNFADAFTAAVFVVLDLGMDMYIRKEVSVRPERASEFIGGIMAIRIVMVLFIVLGMDAVLTATGRGEDVKQLVHIYAVAQFFIVGAATSGALLQATGKVSEMSVLTVVTKVVWAAGVVAAIVFDLGLWAFASAFALSEFLKSMALMALARRHLGLRLRFRIAPTRAAIVASSSFYVAALAATTYSKVDVTILGVVSTNKEVGWYGAAAGLAGLTMLLAPLINWVLVPLYARSADASEAELCRMIRRSFEFILTAAIPVSLMMIVGADLWVSLVFGEDYAPAAIAMQALAAAHLLMYISIICWCALTMLKRTWRVTLVFVAGLFINPTLNLLMIEPGLALLGDGGGGAACALTTVLTEIFIASTLMYMLGRRGVDRRLVLVTVKSVVACAIVIALDRLALREFGIVRLPIAAAVYATLALASGAVDVRGTIGWIKHALRQRQEAKRAAASG